MTDAMQRKMDADSRNGTFEVDPNHPAFGVSYCPMCGGEVGRDGECLSEPSDDRAAFGRIVMTIAGWAIHKPALLCVFSHKLINPALSIRQIAASMHVSKSQASQYLNEVCELMPQMRVIMGLNSPRARAQQTRRRSERDQDM